MEDLSRFRLKDYSEIMVFMNKDQKKFTAYTNKVCAIIYGMKPGDKYSLERVPPTSYHVFIKVVCMLIDEGTNVEFNSEFNEIRCLEPSPPLKVKTNPENDIESNN